ncbi:MAG: LysM peptidoglycan-binding domain-containing protein [gamma proteobacterium symbiont of Bathyaustriella thionipta]|nr:LysM peptidoglycan-binding domain-containing protein [gamma proteobacterium symbiont of Bathyaustriella thionipta]
MRYHVRKGDSLSTIAHKFKVAINDVRQWNQIKGNLIKPGQKLTLYIDVKNQT